MKNVRLVDKRVVWGKRAWSPRSKVFKWPPDYQLFGGEQRGRRAAAAGPKTSFGRQVDQTFAKMQAPKNIAFFCAPSGLVVWAGLGDDRSAPSEPVSALISFLVPFYRFDLLLVCLLVDGFLLGARGNEVHLRTVENFSSGRIGLYFCFLIRHQHSNLYFIYLQLVIAL